MTVIVKDSFNRADSGALGAAETGQTWQYVGTQSWGVQNNQAYPITLGWDKPVYLDAGQSDNLLYEIKVGAYHSQNQIFWRIAANGSDYYVLQGTTVYSVSNNTWRSRGTLAVAAGDTIKVELRGSEHIIYNNNAEVLRFTDPLHLTATRFGFSANSLTARYDNFQVASLVKAPSDTEPLLTVTDVTGQTHQLTNVKQLVRRRAVNGDKRINYAVFPSESNAHAWDAVDSESTALFKGETYVFKRYGENNFGDRSIKKVEAVHSFFNTMINSFQYNLHSGSQTFAAALTRVFENTPYTYSIVDSFNAETFDNFGRENCLALFKNVLDRYGAEFKVVGNTVYLHREIGAQTDFQYRWKHNIKAIDKQVDTHGLATVIRGYGGTPDENGVYPIELEYRSPNEAIYGELHADPIVNENITTTAGMQSALEKALVDEPQLSITVDVAELGLQTVNEGDRGFIIYEPMNVKVSARIVEIVETFIYLDKKWKLVKTEVTLSNLRNKLSDVTTRLQQTSKRVDRLFEGRELLPYNVLPEAIKNASEAINNSFSEVQYPPGAGIVLQDPNNANLMVRLTSAGIGLSQDGGATYRTAMTGAGIVTNELAAGVIRTNNIQLVGETDLFYWNGQGLFAYNPGDLTRFVRLNSGGLYVAKGAISIERPDGHVIVDNGMLQYDFALQGGNPAYTDEPEVSLVEKYYKTASTTPRNIDYYVFRHDARYVKLIIGLHTDTPGQSAKFYAYDRGGGPEGGSVLGSFITTETNPEVNQVTVTLDFGKPTGNQIGFYARISTSNATAQAYARIIAAYKEG